MLLNSKLFILSPSEIKTFGIQNLTYGSLTNKGLKKIIYFYEYLSLKV